MPATHQSLSGASDEEFLARMVKTHPQRFGDAFWAFFAAHVGPHLPARPVMVDLGCGPGLFLKDLGERYPAVALYGYDVTPAMIEHARQLAYTGAKPALAVHDVSARPLPNNTGSVDLVTMTSVLHLFDEPLPVLAEIRRVLTPHGTLLLHDWARRPLVDYLAWRRETLGEQGPDAERRAFRLFPVHNKYTTEDWRWLLGTAGFTVRHQAQLRITHQAFVAGPAS